MSSCCTSKQCHTQQHIAIIGTGSGAFAAAIKATENGAKVSIIEAADIIGGTCVNIGCVPSKIMIRGAHITQLQKQHNIEGIPLHQPVLDRVKMVKQQQDWVRKLRFAKYEKILQDNEQIELIRGHASFKNNTTLLIKQQGGKERELKADKILIAVGARSKIPDIDGLKATPY